MTFDVSEIITMFINAATGLMKIQVQAQKWRNGTFEGQPPPDHGMFPMRLDFIIPIAVFLILISAIVLFWWFKVRKNKGKKGAD